MSYITFQCYACGKALKVPGDKAGRKAKCHHCGTVLTIPVESSLPEATASQPGTPVAAPAYPAAESHHPQPTAPRSEPVYAQVAPSGSGAFPAASSGAIPPVAFPAATGAAPFSLAQDEEYVPEPAGLTGPPKWKMTRIGFLIVFVSTCVLAGSSLLESIAYIPATVGIIRLMSETVPTADTGRVMLAIGAVISLLASLGLITSYVFCMLGPNKKNSFGFWVAAAAVGGVGALLVMIVRLPTLLSATGVFGGQFSFLVWFMLLSVQLLFGAEVILVCLAARAVAMGLKKKKTAKRSLRPILLAAVYTGVRLVTFLLWYLSSTMTPGPGWKVIGWLTLVLLWLGIGGLAATLVFFILYLWRIFRFIPAR
jgi:hypothetical protein